MGEALRKPRFGGRLGSKEPLPGGNIGRAARAKQIALYGHAEVTDEEARAWREGNARREPAGHWEEFGTHGDIKWVPD